MRGISTQYCLQMPVISRTLGELGRYEYAIAAYKEVEARFGEAEEPELREAAAAAEGALKLN